jgi:hypothetical protein
VTTFLDLINRTHQYLYTGQREQIAVLAANVPASSTSLSFTGPLGGIRANSLVSIDLEMFFVLSVNDANNTAQVMPAWLGSPTSSHSAGAPVTVNPKFSNWQIAQAINEDLDDLSSPDNGLYRIVTADITFNPVQTGYDLSALPSNFIDIRSVRFQQANPTQYLPAVRSWTVDRNQSATYFPSGNALFIYEPGWPGLPLHVQAMAPFNHLNYTTDDVVAVAGLPATATDLPPLGAALILMYGRPFKRGFTEIQGDTRRNEEIPPGLIEGGMKPLAMHRQQRIAAEASRLARQYPTVPNRAR